jgi:hypothetical protein
VYVAAKPPRLPGVGVLPSPDFWLRAGLNGRELSGDSDIAEECIIALCTNFVCINHPSKQLLRGNRYVISALYDCVNGH